MRRALVLVVAALVAALVAIPAGADPPDGQQNFRAAPLKGANEVPAVDTQGQGVGLFKLNDAGDTLSYKLIVANIDNVLQAHIHLGAPGTNGGVVAFLYPDGPPPVLIPGTTNGILAEGEITADSLVGALAGMSLDALIEEMRAGNAYVNVHTTANPGGEIRAQIR